MVESRKEGSENMESGHSISATPSMSEEPTSEIPCSGTQVELSKKRKLTSSVWDSFARVTIDGIVWGVCNNCKTKIKASSTHGTKTMHNHLDKYCRRKNTSDIRQKFLNTSKNGDGKMKVESIVFDQDISRMDLASAIVLHEYPLSIVEHVGFRRFIGRLQPLFQMPKSRNTVKSDILKLFALEKKKLHELFDKVSSRISITTDMWTSRQNKGYMVITAHFVDDNWLLNDVILGFIYVPAPHKGEILATYLMDCLLEWNIERKISTITVDNASNNNTMIRTLLERLTPASFPLNGDLIHMRCGAHVMNLIVKKGLKVIKSTLKLIREHISYWSATPSREEKFEKGCNDLKIPYTKKLALDCPTRWNSTYLMLESGLVYKDVFSRMSLIEKHDLDVPLEEEWVLAREICSKLKLFHSITELFSGTNYPTTNYLFPKICEIKLALDSWCNCGVQPIEEWARAMMETFDDYWGGAQLVGGIATILDPRYKMKFLKLVLEKIYGKGSPNEMKVDYTSKALFLEYERKFKSKDASYGGDSSGVASQSSMDGEWDLFSEYDIMVSDASTQTVKSELDLYLEENAFPRVPNFDVLNWWKANGAKYPTLQRIARDILATPVSTVASESAFSTSGRVVSPHRSRLSPTVLEALMCTQDWLWKEMKENGSAPADGFGSFMSMICHEEFDEECDD